MVNMNKKLFVAGSIEDVKEIRQFIKILENRGYIITEDWTKHMLSTKGNRDAENNLIGIHNCDTFIMYLSGTKSSGKMFELGYAEALKRPILLFGPQIYCTSVYYTLNAFEFAETIFDLFDKLEIV